MLSSELPWATKSVLLALGVFMSADGSRARPGLQGLATITGLSSRALGGHLAAAVDKGYLQQVARGGYRGGRGGGAGPARASVYAASVPKDVFDIGTEILMGPPWRRRNEPEADDGFTSGTSPADGPVDGMNRKSDANEPEIQRNEPEASFHPSRSDHHVLGDHVLGEDQSRRVYAIPHDYDEDPEAAGVCRCRLPALNAKAHRRAS